VRFVDDIAEFSPTVLDILRCGSQGARVGELYF